MSFDPILGKRPGRNKIVYNPAELERPPIITLVLGMQNIGKTYQTIKDIDAYVQDNPKTGKKAGKVLILDFSMDESYEKYKPVLAQNVRQLTEPRARRIIPFDVKGVKFDREKKKEVANYVVDNYMNGLLIMDDLDNYMTGRKGESMIGAMTTVRHQGLDLMITHQAAGKVTTTEWENASYIRLHHQLDDIDKDIKNYPLIKIAYIIVKNRYFAAQREWEENKIDDKEKKIKQSFYVYIDMKAKKILRAPEEEFKKAALEFIRINPYRISERMRVGDELGRELTKDQAVQSLYSEYSMFFPKVR